MLSADYYTNEGLDCQNKLVTVKLSFKSMAAFGGNSTVSRIDVLLLTLSGRTCMGRKVN